MSGPSARSAAYIQAETTPETSSSIASVLHMRVCAHSLNRAGLVLVQPAGCHIPTRNCFVLFLLQEFCHVFIKQDSSRPVNLDGALF